MLPQFTEVFYGNPSCKTKGKDLPHNGRNPRRVMQMYGVYVNKDNSTLIGAEKDVFLWCSSMSLVCSKLISTAENLPPKTPMPANNTITPVVIVEAINIIMRNMSIFLDRPYMACIRIIMMACMISQSGQYTAAEQLTAQHCIDDDSYPCQYKPKDGT